MFFRCFWKRHCSVSILTSRALFRLILKSFLSSLSSPWTSNNSPMPRVLCFTHVISQQREVIWAKIKLFMHLINEEANWGIQCRSFRRRGFSFRKLEERNLISIWLLFSESPIGIKLHFRYFQRKSGFSENSEGANIADDSGFVSQKKKMTAQVTEAPSVIDETLRCVAYLSLKNDKSQLINSARY